MFNSCLRFSMLPQTLVLQICTPVLIWLASLLTARSLSYPYTVPCSDKTFFFISETSWSRRVLWIQVFYPQRVLPAQLSYGDPNFWEQDRTTYKIIIIHPYKETIATTSRYSLSMLTYRTQDPAKNSTTPPASISAGTTPRQSCVH